MGTVIRPEISEQSPYYISRHRYYELKHFCLQYPEWEIRLKSIDGLGSKSAIAGEYVNAGKTSDPTAMYAEARLYLSRRMRMVTDAAEKSCGYLAEAMVESVTLGIPYEKLAARGTVHCGKDLWYAAYRRFFWVLDKLRE